MNDYTVRPLAPWEREAALELVWRVFTEFEAPDYSDEGVAEFRRSVWSSEYLNMLTLYGAFSGPALAGVLATRSGGSHIALFFVDSRCQRKGIGKALFQKALTDCPAGVMTVNSSPYAVPVYHALGFTDTGVEQQERGVRYTPMEYLVPRPDSSDN